MRLALLSGANPRIAKDGPKVRLGKGNWKLEFTGVRDSRLWVKLQSQPFANPLEDVVAPLPVHDNVLIHLEFPSCVQLIWEHRGTETHIGVIAEKQ